MARRINSQKKVDIATEADWSFHQDRRAVNAVETAARRAAREFEAVEYADAVQNALLWLAVRPERYDRAVALDEWRELGQDIYANALRPAAVDESNKRRVTTSRERLEEETGWGV